ncbi:MAG TPA: hypothetical protein VNE71_13440, partial [Myxococcota bacterium]|nr:hypothetical protein [Myxococcota bacterium]
MEEVVGVRGLAAFLLLGELLLRGGLRLTRLRDGRVLRLAERPGAGVVGAPPLVEVGRLVALRRRGAEDRRRRRRRGLRFELAAGGFVAERAGRLGQDARHDLAHALRGEALLGRRLEGLAHDLP